ncbi:S41 family peptidase [Roseibacterium beibuensis]|uniref:S41 family peptidase n=1 Tax=[Roseibacterium] beibuensis TaxID=1193142 RepID=UPI00217E7176|nr:S41 family peptidase [Roseibacterium beibuensis]MCS6625430.1 S41 family peptidase [Roseibacterium beibuensis]
MALASEANARVFDAVWRRVDRNYYDPARTGAEWDAMRVRYRPQAMAAAGESDLYAILNQMLASLEDGHATALPPTLVRNRLAQREGRSTSVGLSVRPLEGALIVADVHPGSPASSAGVRPGWVLADLDGLPVDHRAFTPNPPHNAGFLDENGVRVEVRLEAGEFAYAPIRTAERTNDGCLHIAFRDFLDGVSDWVTTELERGEPSSLILDLRGNGGGLRHEMHQVLDRVFDRRVNYGVERARTGRPRQLSVAGSGPAAFDGPMVVLVDDGSISAAELAAAVLQEAGRAIVIGQQTAGSVLFAFLTNLPDGGQLRLSERDLVLRSGRRLEGLGVTPDQVVRKSLQDWRTGRDPALAVARDHLRSRLAAMNGGS